jgi:hypothetical protein
MVDGLCSGSRIRGLGCRVFAVGFACRCLECGVGFIVDGI